MKSANIVALVAVALLNISVHANANLNTDTIANPKFAPLSAKKLDESWINPTFNPSDYKTVAVQFGEFDYRPGKRLPQDIRARNNYELPDDEKRRLEAMVAEVFTQQFQQLEHYKFVDLAESDNSTLVVHLRLEDIVNNVPDIQSLPFRMDSFVNEFGASTIAIEFKTHDGETLLFNGKVRDEVDVIPTFGGALVQLERANPVVAMQRTKTHMRRWAKRISRGMDKMVVAAR